MTGANPAEGRAAALRVLLDAVAGGVPGPTGGWSAAVAVGLGAALAEMAAQASRRHLPDSAQLAARAHRLRDRAVELAEADVAAYGKVRDAGGPGPATDAAPGNVGLSTALAEAADVPLAVAGLGAEVTALATRLATHGNPALGADARTGAQLAEAGARAAAELVAVNTAAGDLDEERANQARARAEDAADSLHSSVQDQDRSMGTPSSGGDQSVVGEAPVDSPAGTERTRKR